MERIIWLPQMTLGIPAMDAAHMEIVDEMNHVAALPHADFPSGLYALIAKLERDFKAEEELMESIEFPALPNHREQHARVLSGLHHVVPRVMNGDIAAGREAIKLLPQWFLFHLTTMDTALAVGLKKADLRAARSAAPIRAG